MPQRLDRWRDRELAFQQDHEGEGLRARRALWERAIGMSAGETAQAFDLTRESGATRAAFGDTRVGQGCLLARRLVEAGARFVEVVMPGWDLHRDAYPATQDLVRQLDLALASLLDDLERRGLLSRTLVVCTTEFGRKPTVNARGGRDHHAEAYCAVLAGAGVAGGRLVGATDAVGGVVVERPVGAADLLRTVARKLGVDPDRELSSRLGRPVSAIGPGSALPEVG